MNKLIKIILAILAGIEAVVYIATPILLSTLLVTLLNTTGWKLYFFYIICLLATLFRAIKIGWLKGGNGRS